MWCCCGRKRDNSKLMDDQVIALAEKCALVANNLRTLMKKTLDFGTCCWIWMIFIMTLTVRFSTWIATFNRLFKTPASAREGINREEDDQRQKWSELKWSTNEINNTSDYRFCYYLEKRVFGSFLNVPSYRSKNDNCNRRLVPRLPHTYTIWKFYCPKANPQTTQIF